jgi:hypothetical protein
MSQENVEQESEVKVPQLASFFIETGRITRSYGMHFTIGYTYYCDEISFAILPHNRKWIAFYLPLKRRVEVTCFDRNGKENGHFEFSYQDETLYDSCGGGLATGKEIVNMAREAIQIGLEELNRRAEDFSIRFK